MSLNYDEVYQGSIDTTLHGIPAIEPLTIHLKEKATTFQRVATATRRRFFNLKVDWKATVGRVNYKPELNGTIVVPRNHEGKEVDYDGASIPFPWLISLLTIGILRPLGILLTPSLVHDFAFKFGYLMVERDGNVSKVPISRDETDRLFRDLIATITKIKGLAWVAWYAVRLGYFLGVRYNGKLGGGKKPLFVGLTTFTSVAAFLGAIALAVNNTDSFQEGVLAVGAVLGVLFMIWLCFYLCTILVLLAGGFVKKKTDKLHLQQTN